MPAGSKIDPLLAKDECSTDGGSIFGIMYFKRGNPFLNAVQLQLERGVRICQRNSSADTKAVRKAHVLCPPEPLRGGR